MSASASALNFKIYSGDGDSLASGDREQAQSMQWSSAYYKMVVSELNAVESRYICSGGHSIAPRQAIRIASLDRAGLCLKEPIQIYVESSGSGYIAYSVDLDEFVTSDDEQSSISELKASIVDTYYILKEDQHRLGPLQQAHWQFLQRIVSEV